MVYVTFPPPGRKHRQGASLGQPPRNQGSNLNGSGRNPWRTYDGWPYNTLNQYLGIVCWISFFQGNPRGRHRIPGMRRAPPGQHKGLFHSKNHHYCPGGLISRIITHFQVVSHRTTRPCPKFSQFTHFGGTQCISGPNITLRGCISSKNGRNVPSLTKRNTKWRSLYFYGQTGAIWSLSPPPMGPKGP